MPEKGQPAPIDSDLPVVSSRLTRFLDGVERLGNRLPDPAILFLWALLIVAVLSAVLAGVAFEEIDPRTAEPIVVYSMLHGERLAAFLANMVKTFTDFAPLGVVLVAMLGVGVADRSGYISAGLKLMLRMTPGHFLTPMIVLVATISNIAVDAGYVLVIPLAAVIFHAAGRHPLAGIAAAFCGVSGGFSANLIPSALDPLLQSFTQSAARILDPAIVINPLNNWFFIASSTVLVVLLGWFITDRVVEPRLNKVELDGEAEEPSSLSEISSKERRSFWLATWLMLLGLVALVVVSLPTNSPLRDANGELTSFSAPLMRSIVPLIFLLFVVPGVLFGYLNGTFRRSKDVIDAMSSSMGSMAYYIVMAFFCAQFIAGFNQSNLGALLALKGADFLRDMALPTGVAIVGIVFLTACINLLVGSASAKWALIGPILVPMLMQLGISPDLTQAAYRVGDSSSNIVTPLMPYFPLVVVYTQQYVKSAGIGTLLAMMLPYSIALLISWSIYMLLYWMLGIPLGLQSSYEYPGL